MVPKKIIVIIAAIDFCIDKRKIEALNRSKKNLANKYIALALTGSGQIGLLIARCNKIKFCLDPVNPQLCTQILSKVLTPKDVILLMFIHL